MRQLEVDVALAAHGPGDWRILGFDLSTSPGPMKPGQFVMIEDPGGYLRRPLFLYQQEGSRTLFLHRLEGDRAGWLGRLRPGDAVDILAPLGRPFHLEGAGRSLLLIWEGGAVEPLLGLANEAARRGHSATLLAGTAGPELPSSLLPDSVEVRPLRSDEPLEPYLRWADQVFAAGGHDLGARMRGAALEAKGFLDGRIRMLAPGPLVCGAGVCGGCVVQTRRGTRRVCREGLDLRLDEMAF
jgi:dihydroorotate dehydrogenase electron transfer subunit